MYYCWCLTFAFSGTPPITSLTGETAHLRCKGAEVVNSPVDWYYQTSLDAEGRTIVAANHLTNGAFGGRLGMMGSILTISRLTMRDSGIYTCRENAGAGPQHQTTLYVRSHGKISRRAGFGSCGIDNLFCLYGWQKG